MIAIPKNPTERRRPNLYLTFPNGRWGRFAFKCLERALSSKWNVIDVAVRQEATPFESTGEAFQIREDLRLCLQRIVPGNTKFDELIRQVFYCWLEQPLSRIVLHARAFGSCYVELAIPGANLLDRTFLNSLQNIIGKDSRVTAGRFRLVTFLQSLSCIGREFIGSASKYLINILSKRSRSSQLDGKKLVLVVGTSPSEMSLHPDELSLPNFFKDIGQHMRSSEDELKIVICGKRALKDDEIRQFNSERIQFVDRPASLAHLSDKLAFAWFFLSGLFQVFGVFWSKKKWETYLLDAIYSSQKKMEKILYRKVVLLIRPFSGYASINTIQIALDELRVPVLQLQYSSPTAALPSSTRIRLVDDWVEYACDPYMAVWSESVKSAIDRRKVNRVQEIYVVGPLMFTGKASNSSEHRADLVDNTFRLGVFDIGCYKKDFLDREEILLSCFEFTLVARWIKTVLDVAKETKGRNLVVVRKIKRSRSSIHDLRFDEFVEKTLKELDIAVQEYAPTSSPWLALLNCDAVVASPFTSLAEAAFQVGIKSCFFTTDDTLVSSIPSEVPVIQGRKKFREWMQSLSKESFANKTDPREIINGTHVKLAKVIDQLTSAKDAC